MKEYLLTKDVAGYNGFGLEFPDTTFSAVLTTNTNTQLTVPSTSDIGASYSTIKPRYIALIVGDPNAIIYFNINNNAAVANGATFSAVTSVLLNMRFPVGYVVSGGDVLNFIASTTTGNDLSVSFYRIAS